MDSIFYYIKEEFDLLVEKLPVDNLILVFSLMLFIILLSPILLRRIRIPSIIGLIISGVIIGPKGFYILEKTEAIELFSMIGLLYIMFMAGLELDMNDFRRNQSKSLVFGLLTFALPMGIGFPVCHYLLGYDVTASLLTASMFSTHTLVAYPIVSKLGISRNQAVSTAVGGTILTDTAVLLLLAIIIGSKAGTLNQEFWLRLTVSLAIFLFIMFFIVPRVARWFFRKLESEKHSHYIFVLAVVFFAAFLAEAAGVEKIIGAFVAGLALNRLIPHTSPLMNRIEFIGNSLFIPFFLISVGMLVDLKVLLNGPTALIVAATLILVALTGKWVAAFVTQLIYKYSTAQRQLIFGLSSSHAAATLAVILVGFEAHILDENILNGTILLILVTCVVATFATDKAAKSIVRNAEAGRQKPSFLDHKQSEHILLPIANFSNMEKLLDFAVLIKNKQSKNPVSLVCVVPNDEEAEQNILIARAKLESMLQHASATETSIKVLATIDHNAASGIARTSREIMADTIVLGWPQRPAFVDRVMGEKTEGILESTDKTTFICRILRPLASHKRVVILCHPLAEEENGFEAWLSKMFKLAQELSVGMAIHANDKTQQAIIALAKKEQWKAPTTFHPFVEWEEFPSFASKLKIDDLLVVVANRKATATLLNVQENLPSRLDKFCAQITRVLVYPQEFAPHVTQERFEKSTSDT
jgi:Kef-type K+ transport system membrane component KefB